MEINLSFNFLNKNKSFVLLTIVLVALTLIPIVNAAIPQFIQINGRLTNTTEFPQTGSFTFNFSLYTAATGGNAVWSELQNVTVTRGVFNVTLGSNTTLNIPFDVPYWLGIKVGGDNEMVPRLRVTSSPFGFRANITDFMNGTAAGDLNINSRDLQNVRNITIISTGNITFSGDTLLYRSAANVLKTDDSFIVAGSWLNASTNLNVSRNAYIGGNLGINTTNPSVLFEINGSGNTVRFRSVSSGNGATAWFEFKQADDTRTAYMGDASANDQNFYIGVDNGDTVFETGDVGIGTTNPLNKLDVVGSINATGNLTVNGSIWQPMYGSDDGLVLYLPFSEGPNTSTVFDRSPYGNDGTLTNMNISGNTTSGWNTTDCKAGYCLRFDGINDYVDVGNAASLDIRNATTVEAWVKPNDTSSTKAIVGKWNTGPSDGSYILIIENSGWKFLIISGGAVRGDTAFGIPQADVWKHVAGTFDGSTIKVYENGVLIGSTSYSGTIDTTSHKVGIGTFRGNEWKSGFNGTIDEVKIYNRALSPDEIRTQYLGGLQSHGVIIADKFRIVNTTGNVTGKLLEMNNSGLYVDDVDSTFRVDTANNRVGIGTTSPLAKLEIQGSGTGGISFNATNDLFVNDSSGNVGIGTTNPSTALHVYATAASLNKPLLRVEAVDTGQSTYASDLISGSVNRGDTSAYNLLNLTNVGTAKFVVRGDGNVGIGTTGPSVPLTVWSTSTTPVLNVTISDTGVGASTGYILAHQTTGTVAAETTGVSQDFYFTSNRSGNPLLQAAKIETTASKAFAASSETTKLTLYTQQSGTLSAALTLNGSKVGLGTTDPEGFLHIVGGANINPAIRIEAGIPTIGFRDSTEQDWSISVDEDFRITSTSSDFATSNIHRLFINSGGNVSIGGTAATEARLTVVNTSIDAVMLRLQDSDGTCDHNPESSSESVSCTSDIRLKKNIRDAPSTLDEIMKIPVRQFELKATGDTKIGVIAQEMLTLLPDYVKLGDSGYYQVEEVSPWKLVKAIQELKAENEALKHQNQQLNESLVKLSQSFEARLAALEEKVK